jgi:hypothetical protein
VVTFVGTLIALPIFVARIPADYFRRDRRYARHHGAQSAVLRVLGWLLKNLLGVVLILAGVAMLVLPGQGILTILIGIMLMNFPGKHALEQRIVQQPSVLRAINWMRARAHQPALEAPEAAAVPADNGQNSC